MPSTTKTADAVALVDALPRCAKQGCDGPGLIPGKRYSELRYCSPQHRGVAEPRGLTCSHCGGLFMPRLSGRPPAYCSRECRDARRALLKQAFAELAERRAPDSLDDAHAMLNRAQTLAGFLAAASGDHELVHQTRHVVRVHWQQGKVPTPLKPVDRHVVKAAFSYASLLYRLTNLDAHGQLRHGEPLADRWQQLVADQERERRAEAGVLELGDDGIPIPSPWGAARKRTRVDPIRLERDAVERADEPDDVGDVDEEGTDEHDT